MQLIPHHVGIVVSDMDRSTAFYEELGFETTAFMPADDGSKAIKFMALGPIMVELFWYAQTPEASAPLGRGERRLGFKHLALRTEDFEGTLAELKAKTLVPRNAVTREIPGRFKLVYFEDPDGLEIEVMQEG